MSRLLKIIEHVSLDGVIQHSADDGDYPYGDWTVPYRTPEGRDAVQEVHGDEFDLLLGRRTYDIWSAFWPTAQGIPIGERINAATKYVVTHWPDSLGWAPSVAVGTAAGGLGEAVEHIKSEAGPDIVVSGSSTLTSTLLAHGLADEIVLITYPVLLGTGKRLLAAGFAAQSFTLGATTTTPTGVRITRLRPTGPLATQ